MSIWMPDIAPTLSGYLGFPMSQHSDGKIIADIFET